LTICVTALVLSIPFFVRGPLLSAHDTRQHIHFGEHFAEQFWQGEFYPRWLLNMNHGLGSPSLFIYPPFPSYVYALLLPVAAFIHMDAYVAGAYLCLLTSGLCAFLWIRTMADERVSCIVAMIYMFFPYHLTIDFFLRGALPECWALAWLPLVLYFTTQAAKMRRGAVAGLAFAFALLIVSHLISVLIASALPILLAITVAERGKRARALIPVVGGLALGAGISAAYLVPALVSAKYFPVSRLDYLTDWSIRSHLLSFGMGLLTGPSVFIRAASLATADMALFIAFCALVTWKNGSRNRQRQTLMWLAICAVSLFFMLTPSFRFWKALPLLTSAIQFPWRLDILLCIAALPLSAFLLTDLYRKTRFRVHVIAIVALFAGTWLAGYVACLNRYAVPPYYTGAVNEQDGWFSAWTPFGMNQASALQASEGPRARFISGRGSVAVLSWKPRQIRMRTECDSCGPLMISQFYYPKWQAKLIPDGRVLDVGPALPQGLLEVQVPPGQHQVLMEIPRQVDEEVGNSMSALSVVAMVAILAFSLARARCPPRPEDAHTEAVETPAA
jgi:hypothetical protein